MYAVIVSGGKQYRVTKGDTIYVEKLNQEDGSVVDFDVLLLGSDEGVQVGAPTVAGAVPESGTSWRKHSPAPGRAALTRLLAPVVAGCVQSEGFHLDRSRFCHPAPIPRQSCDPTTATIRPFPSWPPPAS